MPKMLETITTPRQRIRDLECQLGAANQAIIRQRRAMETFKAILEKHGLVDEYVKALEAA